MRNDSLFIANSGATTRDFIEVVVDSNVAIRVKGKNTHGLRLAVLAFEGVDENLWRRMERNSRYMEDTETNRTFLVGLAKTLVSVTEKDYHMRFWEGDAAWNRRKALFGI